MKNYLYLIPVAVALLTLSACNEEPSVSSDTESKYPLTTCVVSGEELGSMGEPVTVSHGGITVQLCCDSCIKKFNADPEKYTAMVKNAK